MPQLARAYLRQKDPSTRMSFALRRTRCAQDDGSYSFVCHELAVRFNVSTFTRSGIISHDVARPLYLRAFCRTKCSYCNIRLRCLFRALFERYVERLTADINRAGRNCRTHGRNVRSSVDSIFLGGGTPTILDITQLERAICHISQKFGSEVMLKSRSNARPARRPRR